MREQRVGLEHHVDRPLVGRDGREVLTVDQQAATLRLKYVPIFNKVVSGKKTALFFQLDRRLVMLIDLQLASQIPMVQP